MKFTIEKASLIKPLAHIQSIVERRNTVPVLSNVLIEAKGSTISMTATDMDMEVQELTGAKIKDGGVTTVSAHMLYEIARKLPDGAEIDLSLSGDRLTVKSGRSNFTLPTLAPDDFPKLHTNDFDTNFVLPAAVLTKMIDRTRFAMSTEETRYYLNGIFLHAAKSEGKAVLRAVATDGHRLARFEVEIPKGAKDMPGVILPRKMVGELRKLLDGAEDVEVALSTSLVRFSFNGIILTSKLIDGTFPEYERVIPSGNDKHMEVDCKIFADAVDRVAIISTEKTRAVKLAVSKGNLQISATSAESGSAEEDIEVKYQDDEMKIGFNARYILDIAEQMTGKIVQFSLADATAPAILRDPSDVSALFVLMPMRV